MSYSMTAGPFTKGELGADDIEAALKERAATIPDGEGTPAKEIDEHLTASARAISHILEVLGVDEDQVTVSLSGHADPGHEQRPNWSPEFVQLQVHVQRRV